jgi:hypothetical protein
VLERQLHTASAILQVSHRVSTHPYTISELPTAALFTNLAQFLLTSGEGRKCRTQTHSHVVSPIRMQWALAENVTRRHTHPSFFQLRMQWAAVSIHRGLISSPVQVPGLPPSLLMIRRGETCAQGERHDAHTHTIGSGSHHARACAIGSGQPTPPHT